jgi:hypothetical protein
VPIEPVKEASVAGAELRPVWISAAALEGLVALERLIVPPLRAVPSTGTISVPLIACSWSSVSAATEPPRRYAPTSAVLY